MPIYAYKCESCGFAKDVLQKISDAPLQDCPTCAQPTFKKQLTAAGFRLVRDRFQGRQCAVYQRGACHG
jgi:putative FmdB family regulatory protein